MLIIGGTGSGKTYALLTLINKQCSDNLNDKIYLYPKDLNEPKYKFLIKKRNDVGIKHLKYQTEFIEYSCLTMYSCSCLTMILMIAIQIKNEKF